MRTWIVSNQSTNIIVGIATVFLLIGPTADAVEVRQASGKPLICCNAPEHLVVADALERSVRFQALKTQWHFQRGATSSIEEMCSRPAYLSIMAMGPDVLPLIIGQLKAEGNDPDHWFVALHHVSKGADPVPNQDKGNMIKMSQAWQEWAEREGNAP